MSKPGLFNLGFLLFESNREEELLIDIRRSLEEGKFMDAIRLFIDRYQRVNAVAFVPAGDSFLTIQVPLNQAAPSIPLCRADFIIKDDMGNKIMHHGFIQFPASFVKGYSYEGDLLKFNLHNGTQIRILGL